MPRHSKTHSPPPPEFPSAATEKHKKAVIKFRDFASITDRVEIVDPAGALEWLPNESSAYTSTPPNGGGQGRPFVRVTPLGCQIVKFYAENGLSHTMIGTRLGIKRETFHRCMRDQPEVAEALAAGKGEAEYELQECLMGMARRGNVIAAIYLTKARHGWRDNDPPPEAKSNLQIVINAPLSADDFKRMRESGVTPMQLPGPKLEEPTGLLAEAEEVTR